MFMKAPLSFCAVTLMVSTISLAFLAHLAEKERHRKAVELHAERFSTGFGSAVAMALTVG